RAPAADGRGGPDRPEGEAGLLRLPVLTFTDSLQLAHRARTAAADTGIVTCRTCLPLAATLALLGIAPAAASASTVNVNGKGLARFQTARSAEVIGVQVNAPGRVRLVDADNPAAASFKPKCVRRGRKTSLRPDRRTHDWIVLRAVKFIYDGQGFTMRVTSTRGFRVTISGVGRLKLNGRGTYTLDGGRPRFNRTLPRIQLKMR